MSGLTNAADAELTQYKKMQEEITKLREKQQTLMQQLSENEMVKTELDLISSQKDESKIFKLVGPILMPQDLTEAQQTVEKRLEFITSDMSKLESQIATLEGTTQQIAQKIQAIQGDMQRQAQAEAQKLGNEGKQQIAA